jgi:hypothetical protein
VESGVEKVPENAAALRPHGPARVVTESYRDGGASVEVVTYRKPIHADRMEMPCADCEVGEPHVCPLWRPERVEVTYR